MSLQDLAATCNPHIRGWINYYGHFYRTRLRPSLKRIDAFIIRWARRKLKRLRRHTIRRPPNRMRRGQRAVRGEAPEDR
jgi:transposase